MPAVLISASATGMLFETIEFLVDWEFSSPRLGKVVSRCFGMSIWALRVVLGPLGKTLR